MSNNKVNDLKNIKNFSKSIRKNILDMAVSAGAK